MTTVTASREPYMGFRKNPAPGKVEHYPAPVLSFSEKAEKAELVTLLYPSKAPGTTVSVERTEEGITVTVNGKKHTVETK